MTPNPNSSSSFALEEKKSRDDDKPIWTTTPSQNKIKEFLLSKRIKLKAKHYLETLFALLVLHHLVKFMFLLKATRRCATDNTYPPRILKNFHNKSYENKQKNSKITIT
jgi:hypothetical protein